MENLKRIFYVLIAVISILAAVVLFVEYGASGIASFRQEVDLYADGVDYGKLTSRDHIHSKFKYSLGCFLVETTAKTEANHYTGELYYYAVPVYSQGETYWVGLEVHDSKDVAEIQAVTKDIHEYLSGEWESSRWDYLDKHGSLKKLSWDRYAYMLEAFTKMDLYGSYEEMKQHVLPVYIHTYDPFEMRVAFAGLLFAEAMCIMVAVFSARAAVKTHKTGGVMPDNGDSDIQGIYAQNFIGQAADFQGSTQGEGAEAVVLFGVPYPRGCLEGVNAFVEKGQLEEAKEELHIVTGLSGIQADEAIAQWKALYK